jgi:hypothetical protein
MEFTGLGVDLTSQQWTQGLRSLSSPQSGVLFLVGCHGEETLEVLEVSKF